MKIILAKSNDDFKNLFKEYLKDEVTFQLFWRNLSSDHKFDNNAIRGGVFIDEKCELIFLNAFPFNLQIYSVNKNPEAFSFLIDYILKQHITIRGVQGNKINCELFIKEYTKQTKTNFKLFFAMNSMKLTEDNLKKQQITGHLRLAASEDIALVAQMYKDFLVKTLKEEVDEEKVHNLIMNMIENRQLYVYLNKENHLTSCLTLLENFIEGGTLTGVFTDEKYRNRGYAKEMIYLFAKDYLKTKKFLTLFVDQTNPISNKLYVNIGFKYWQENYDYRLEN